MARDVTPLRLLPRFDSQITLNQTHSEIVPSVKSTCQYHSFSFDDPNLHDPPVHQKFISSELINRMLPRYHSEHQRIFNDENQSADIGGSQIKTKNSATDKVSHHTSEFDIRFLERFYDRSGQRCRPTVNPTIGKMDLEYVYTVVGDALESYIRCRKLNRCKALSNFLDYRDKVYKREKVAHYAPVQNPPPTKEIPSKTPAKMNQLVKKRSSITPAPSDTLSVKVSTPSAGSLSPAPSEKGNPPAAKESFIPIPSPDLLRNSELKSSKMVTTPKQSQLKIPKKVTSNIKQVKVQRSPSTPIKGQW